MSDGAYHAVAEDIAADRGERIVRTREEALPAREAVVIVAAPEDLTELVLRAYQDRLSEQGPEDGAFSIVTGYTPADARDLYMGCREVGETRAVLLQDTPTGNPDISDATTLRENELTAEALENFTGDQLEALSIFSHGTSIHLNLPSGFICGYPMSVDPAAYNTPQPECVVDGEISCPFEEDLVRAEQLTASHVFISSCASAIDNNLQELPVHLGLGLLRGASSLVASYRPSSALPAEAVIHDCLLRGGYDLAQRVYIHGKFTETLGTISHSYIGFGDPRSTSTSGREQRYCTDITSTDDGGVKIEVRNVEADVIDISIPADLLSETSQYHVREIMGRDEPLYYAAFPEENSLRIVVCSGDRMDSPFTLEVSGDPAAASDRWRLEGCLRNAERARRFDLLSEKGVRQYRNLFTRVSDLPENAWKERYEATHHRNVTDESAQIEHVVEAMAGELASVTDDGLLPIYSYHNRAVNESAGLSDTSCADCGRRLYFRDLSDGAGTWRTIGNCPRCGNRYDVPGRDDQTESPPRVLEVAVDDSGLRRFEATFTNDRDGPVEASMYPFIEYLGRTKDETQLVDPAERRWSLEPGESVKGDFIIDQSAIEKHRFRAGVQIVANLRTHVGITWLLEDGHPSNP